MLKKVILGIIIGTIVMTTSAGFLYAYQKESVTRQNFNQQSNIAADTGTVCTNEDCVNYGTDQTCTNDGTCTNSQNNQNGQGLRNGQGNNENCTGTCLNSNGTTTGNSYNMQNMMRNRFKNNQ